jgi:hypothetical protein
VLYKKLASLAALCICCSLVAADEDDEWNNRWDAIAPGERFKIRVGTFLVDRTDTSVRFDSNRFPLGTLIDLEDDLNVDQTERVGRLDGFYRFTNKHRIEWSYYTSRRSGEAVAEREFQIGDPDNLLGGFVIPKGARVETQWNFDLFKLGYDYSFLNKERYEMFIGAGLNIRSLDFDIAYQANIGSAVAGNSIDTKELLPLPTATIGGRWNLTRKLQAIFSYDLFFLEFEEYKGQYQEVLLSLEHSTFKHVGFGAAIDLGSLNVRSNTDDFRGEYDYSVGGLFGYVKFYL